jgi:hypothetical protein
MKAGDIVGSGEKVYSVIQRAVNLPSNKCKVILIKNGSIRHSDWGKYTQITVERAE